MLNEEYTNQYSSEMSFRDFLIKTFEMVAVGLAITTTVAFVASKFIYEIYSVIGYVGYMALLIGEVVLVIVISAKIMTLSKPMAYTLYFLYAVLNGVNMSYIFLIYTGASVVFAFAMTAVLFVCMSVIGHTTQVDLTKYSSLFFIGLVVLIIAGIFNIFFYSDLMSWLVCALGIVLFLGIIAYDMQRLRYIYNEQYSNSDVADNLVIYGALQLYLDFINLFLRILRMFGKRRD